jgi:hypothetical protein
MKTYSASFDNTVKILSAIITLSILVIEGNFIFNIAKAVSNGMALSAFIGKIFLLLILISIVLFTFLFSIKDYAVNDNTLFIQRWINTIKIPFSEIKTVRVLNDNDMGMVFRTFGVGGLFGYFGKFSSSKLGSITYYATQNKNKVFVELKSGKKIVITPDDTGIVGELSDNKY